MESGIAIASIGVTVIIGLFVLAYKYGELNNKVKTTRERQTENEERTEKNISDIRQDFREYKAENKADHNQIFGKLDTIIRNGNKKG